MGGAFRDGADAVSRVVAALGMTAFLMPAGCQGRASTPVPVPVVSAQSTASTAAPAAISSVSPPAITAAHDRHPPIPVPPGSPHAPGTVRCGGAAGRCDRGEACCEPNPQRDDPDGQAPSTVECVRVPPGSAPMDACSARPGGSFGPTYTCDDSIDCAEGQRCEEQQMSDGEWSTRLCTGDAEVQAEACVAGGRCRTPGTSCDGTRGRCELPRPSVALHCGAAVCKPSEGCCHDGHLHTAYCSDDTSVDAVRKKCPPSDASPSDKRDGPTRLVYCTTSRDCRANEWCLYGPVGSRSTFCSRAAQMAQACVRAADCRPGLEPGPTCKKYKCEVGECSCGDPP